MAFDFPASPTVGQQYVSGSAMYVWNGFGWAIAGTPPQAAAAFGAHQVPYFAETEMYLTPFSISSTSITSQACSSNQIWFVPLIVPWTRTFTRIAISIPAAGSIASSNARLGLYNVDTASGRPGAVFLDAGNVATDVVALRTITINQVVPAGAYFAAAWTSHAITIRTVAAGYCPAVVGVRLGNASPHAVASFTRNSTFGSAFADESAQTHTLQASGMAPLIGLR